MRVGISIVAAALCLGTPQVSMAADFAAPTGSKNWTGFYAGAHIGSAWVKNDGTFLSTTGVATVPLGTVFGMNSNGALGGLQAGYNYQWSNWVVGLEGDFSWTGAKGTSTSNGSIVILGVTLPTSNVATTKVGWYATVGPRLGVVVNNFLFFAKGGAAWTSVTMGGSVTGPLAITTYNDIKDTRTGWTLGGGLEWAVIRNWSVKLDYSYLNFGTKRYTLTGVTPGAANITSTFDFKNTAHLVKAGLNYHF